MSDLPNKIRHAISPLIPEGTAFVGVIELPDGSLKVVRNVPIDIAHSILESVLANDPDMTEKARDDG